MKFELIRTDGKARAGRIITERGVINTPAFMPVGTAGTVKSLTPEELVEAGTEIILANTYHLYLRPGYEAIRELGGLHRFINWNRPILTDSGGFQVFSLTPLRKVSDDGVEFRSHIDGLTHFITPEKSIEIQEALDSDIMMAFDDCTGNPTHHESARRSMERTHLWAERSFQARKVRVALFGIVQGGAFEELREESASRLTQIDFDGFAVGGVSVGEPREDVERIINFASQFLPEVKPRYLMGLGTPGEIVRAVAAGYDIFDCVLPTRNARNGSLFTSKGKINIKREEYARDPSPLDEDCDCSTCRNYSKAYLRHLYVSGEILSSRLNTFHNIYYYQKLMVKTRISILEERFSEFSRSIMHSENIIDSLLA
ncbi:MAG: tRNA guanosine(34) transglycosylase Tgt [Acidobacteriota bacterium]